MSDYGFIKQCPKCGSSPLVEPTSDMYSCCNLSCPLSKLDFAHKLWESLTAEEGEQLVSLIAEEGEL